VSDPDPRSGAERLRALYEQAEAQAADAFEELVSTPSFGLLLARSAENVAAISRIGSDLADLVLRDLRVAGRADVTRLARQLHRTEDKLERLLQEVEGLRDELARERSANGSDDVAEADAATKQTRETGNGADGAGTEALPKRAREPSADTSPHAESDSEPKRTRGAS
jgi:hypothetical protein